MTDSSGGVKGLGGLRWSRGKGLLDCMPRVSPAGPEELLGAGRDGDELSRREHDQRLAGVAAPEERPVSDPPEVAIACVLRPSTRRLRRGRLGRVTGSKQLLAADPVELTDERKITRAKPQMAEAVGVPLRIRRPLEALDPERSEEMFSGVVRQRLADAVRKRAAQHVRGAVVVPESLSGR